ncbi:hypothetical protein C8R45DRAFT_1221655 [Mycena sanguinolenta]|nr:hypothetical protein C8R45DRAFT_1221655 [Mycena sanguinolenta]
MRYPTWRSGGDEHFSCFGQSENRVTCSPKKPVCDSPSTTGQRTPEDMPLFDHINTWEQHHSAQAYNFGNPGDYRDSQDPGEENLPPTPPASYLPSGQGGRQGLSQANSFSFSSSSVPETPGVGHGRASSINRGAYTTGTGISPGNVTPCRDSSLGARKRVESVADWSPPTKVRLRAYADGVAAEYAVPESSREEFLDASTLPTHKLMIITLAAVLGQHEGEDNEARLKKYLASSEFKEHVVGRIRGVLLDPQLPSYKLGFLDRLMRHIRLNPGVYHIPQEFRGAITSKAFNSAVSKAAVGARSDMKRKMTALWNSKTSIYDVLKVLACKTSQEMTDEIWGRIAWIQMRLADYVAGGKPGKEFWDIIDKMLATKREETLAQPPTHRAAYASFEFSEALKYHLSQCKPKQKRKSSQQLPKWQVDISRAVEEMRSYTQEQLAEEEVEDDEEQDGDSH